MPNTIKSLRASILLGFVAILSFSGCQIDNLEPNGVFQREQKVTIEATYEQPEMDTKTVRDDNAKIYWTPGDAISLFFGSGTNGGSKFLAQNDAVALKTTFSGYISAVTGGSDIDDEDTFFWGLYPYDAKSSCDGSSVTMRIPAVQTGKEGTFAPGMAPSLGRSQKLVLSFRNIWSGFGFTVSEPGFQSITFRGNAGEKIAGKARIGIDENNLPKVLEIIEGVQEVTLTAPGGGFVPGQYYYMQFFPCSFESGFSVELVSPTKKGTYNYTKSMEYPRSTWKRAANVDTRVENWDNIDPNEGYDWDDIPVDLVTVNNPTKGGLEDVLLEWGDYEYITSLKVNGTMNDVDFLFIYRDMPNLRYLDISGIDNTTLPNKAFYKSTNVTHVILPISLTEIGDYLFQSSKLEAVKINQNLRKIGMYAFSSCNIRSIEIPEGVETIGAYAFSFSKKFNSLKIPSGVKTIDYAAFYFCGALTSIEIPSSVETIGNYAFGGCDALSFVTFEGGSSLKTIGEAAFCPASRSVLTSIEIPSSVETIGNSAFSGCNALVSVTFEGRASLKTIGNRAFNSCGALTSTDIPSSVETIGENAFYDCDALVSVTFEEGSSLKTIGKGAFYSCGALTSTDIPSSVETIGENAFYDCDALVSVTIEGGSSLKTIGKGAFYSCGGLTSIEIPSSVETIGYDAFSNCDALVSVTFEGGSSLKTIDGKAFRYCRGLTSIEIPSSVEYIGNDAFSKCDALVSVTFASNSKLKNLYQDVFADCIKLTKVSFKENSQLVTIYNAFNRSTNLKTFDASGCSLLTQISVGAFTDFSKLRLFYCGASTPPTIGSNTFSGIDPYAVLKVPDESVDAYKAISNWNSHFSQISGFNE